MISTSGWDERHDAFTGSFALRLTDPKGETAIITTYTNVGE